MIHHGLSANPVVLACALVAQVLTVAALGRAAFLGFYRRRASEYEHLEPIRLGMRVSLILLSAGCVVFGTLAGPFVHRVAGPAASGLLDSAGYAAGALGDVVTLPDLGVHFDYLQTSTALTIAELILGIAVLVLAVRTRCVQR